MPRTLRTYFDPNNHNARKKGKYVNEIKCQEKLPKIHTHPHTNRQRVARSAESDFKSNACGGAETNY